MPPPGAREEDQHRADGDRGDGDDQRRPAAEEAERDPGVLHVMDRERPGEVDALAESKRAPDDLLRELVGQTAAPATSARISHCDRPAASDRFAEETGCSAFAVDPTRTSSAGGSVVAGSLTYGSRARACRRCSAPRTAPPPAAPARSASRTSRTGRTCRGRCAREPRRSRSGDGLRSPRGRRRARAGMCRTRCRRCGRPSRSRDRPSPRADPFEIGGRRPRAREPS